METCLILPVLNEEEALKIILPINQNFSRIIVIDGVSTDNSRQICEDAGIEVIEQLKKGKGNAIRQIWGLLLQENADVACMIDADGTCDLDELFKSVSLISDYDIIVGNRFHCGRPDSMGRIPRFVNWLVSMIISLKLKQRFYDVQSPFWIWNRKSIKILNSGVNATMFELEADMILQAKWADLRIGEVPISYYPRIGKSKFSNSLRLRNLILIPLLILKRRQGSKK